MLSLQLRAGIGGNIGRTGHRRVYLQTLELTDFRNYADLRLDLGPGRFVLVGDNAQGKSNLCEAVRMLSTMRSFRASSDRELVRWGAPGHFARVRGEAQGGRGPVQVEIIISAVPSEAEGSAPVEPIDQSAALEPSIPSAGVARKRVRINGTPKRAIDCVGLVTVVLFEPTDLDLVIGPREGRRHFMDVTLCQISRTYCRALTQYQRILTQRAALLRRIRDNLDDPRALTYWDTQLATNAVPIIQERADLVARCTPTADEVAQRLGGSSLQLTYLPSFPMAAGMPVAEATAAFMAQLATLRRREIAQGVNLLGPHRDDLAFYDGRVNLALYGSRGQQRTAALALKLAELEAMELETGEQPILVLDDVLSELDGARRTALLQRIEPIDQVILTTAESAQLWPVYTMGARMLHVTAGLIKRDN